MYNFKFYGGITSDNGKLTMRIPCLNLRLDMENMNDTFQVTRHIENMLSEYIAQGSIIPAADGYFETIVKIKRQLRHEVKSYDCLVEVVELDVVIS